jgi:outer membrane receptor protein involved in Fe transport
MFKLIQLSLLVFFILFSIEGSAQRPGGGRGGGGPAITGTITGKIIDDATGAPIEFATLVLKQLPTAESNRPSRPGGGPRGAGAQSDSTRLKMMKARMTERLGREPSAEELEAAQARFASRGGGRPAPITEETQVDGTITDLDGNFRFEEVKLGSYAIEASFIGYDKVRIDNIVLTGKQPDRALERITLLPSAALLQEAVVVGEAELVENRIDKIVYNASQDVVNQGGDGADVLRRVPLLSVDLDGNVSLRGSDQVQILINGRPSTMFAGSVGEALQAMPSDEIEKVEVITSPGARYQGEGTAGIINIITKRGGLKGLTGSVNTSIGTRSNNFGANINYTKGRFGINGGIGSRFNWKRPTTTSLLRIDTLATGNLAVLDQSSAGDSNRESLNANIGAFYDVNAYNSFTTSIRVRGRNSKSDLFQSSFYNNPDNGDSEIYTLDRDSRSPGVNFDFTTDYKRKFEGEDHELNVALQVGGSIRNSDYEVLTNITEGDPPVNDEIGLNRGGDFELIGQVDYQRPLNEKLFFETGVQAIQRTITSDFSYEDRFDPSDEFVLDLDRSNVFDYNQDIYAGYVSMRTTLSEKLSAITGLRYEHTQINGSLERPDPGQEPFTNDYGNLLPSINIQYKLDEKSSVRVGYTRRIRRPNLRYINPFVQASDARNVSTGNPELLPELTDQYEIVGNTRIKNGFLNLSLFTKRTTDEITSFISRVNDVQFTEFLNIGSQNSYGGNVFFSYKVGDIIKLRGGFNTEYVQLRGTGALQGLERNVWQYDLNGSGTIELPKDFVVETFGFFRAPRQTLQGERASFSIWSIGAQKKLQDDRWRVGVRIIEPFSRSKSFPNVLNGDGVFSSSNSTVLFRSFGINVRYKFGSLEGNTSRRRSKINSNDGGDGGGGEGEF